MDFLRESMTRNSPQDDRGNILSCRMPKPTPYPTCSWIRACMTVPSTPQCIPAKTAQSELSCMEFNAWFIWKNASIRMRKRCLKWRESRHSAFRGNWTRFETISCASWMKGRVTRVRRPGMTDAPVLRKHRSRPTPESSMTILRNPDGYFF